MPAEREHHHRCHAKRSNIISDSLASRRFAMQILGFFAATAMLLAAIGIYGVMAYFVSQRVREIGVRMALGAQRGDVLKLIVRQGMSRALIGVGVGLVAALALTRLISGLLFDVSASHPVTLAALTALLVLVALLANYIPASRAARVALWWHCDTNEVTPTETLLQDVRYRWPMLAKKCAVKRRWTSAGATPAGNWFARSGSNRSGSGGNEAVGAFGVEGR
jgi:predicted lysophospholipase L1 biosynthesis ABC-type transport system permease subunit